MKKLNLKGKIAIVTGASSGIGKEIATLLVKKYGCIVYGIGRNLPRLDLLREELGPENFLCAVMDVCDKSSWEKMASYFTNWNTLPTVLINCAGMLPKFSSVENAEIEGIEDVMSVNYLSAVYACKYIMPIMEKGGAVVNISSASALCPFAGVAAYSASKAALERFTEALSFERRDLRVSCVMPGFVKTNIMKNQEATEKDKGLINFFSADAKKTAKKILRRVVRRKRRIVVGTDAHFMSFMFRAFPRLAPRFFSWVIKKSGLNLFKNV